MEMWHYSHIFYAIFVLSNYFSCGLDNVLNYRLLQELFVKLPKSCFLFYLKSEG